MVETIITFVSECLQLGTYLTIEKFDTGLGRNGGWPILCSWRPYLGSVLSFYLMGAEFHAVSSSLRWLLVQLLAE